MPAKTARLPAPAERIRLRMEGLPQDTSESVSLAIVSLAIVCALEFCGQPETFPVFRAFTAADAHPRHAEVLSHLSPAVLRSVEGLIGAGILADLEAVS